MKRTAARVSGLRPGSLLVGLLAAVLMSAPVRAEEPAASLFRGSDGEFDLSGYLATRGGFLPVPIVVTEPAIGYGGGLAGVVFHGGNPFRPGQNGGGERFVPPSITGVGGIATENGSWGAAVGHFGVWRGDRVRYIGLAAAASFNLDFWGTAAHPLSTPLEYSVAGGLLLQRLLFRVAGSPLFLGGEYAWSTQKAEFEPLVLPPGSPPRTMDQDDSGLGLVAEYETLDNIFTPNRGMKARVRGMLFSEELGGDNDRQSLDVEAFGFVALHERLNLGIRGDFALSDGDTPFYLLPYVSLRGAPALRYSAKHVALGELELRWRVRGRWSAVGFGGLGYTADSISDFGSDERIGTLGAGFRYLLAERLGLQAGLDFARSPDDSAVYVIVGSAWR